MAKQGYIAGIVIRMGAEAAELGAAIDDATASASKLQRELKSAESAMKLDPKNADLAKQKFDILTESVEQTRKKLDALKEAQKEASAALARGDISTAEYRALTREIAFTESKLKDLEKQAKLAGSGWVEFGDKAKAAGDKLKNAGQKMENIGGKLNRSVTLPIIAIGTAAAKSAADMEALDAQFEQTFGTEMGRANKILAGFSDEFDMLPNRMKPALIQMTAFAKTAGMETPEALDMSSRALRVAADSSAFYDRSLEEVTESLQSFLKGNYANDAALGIAATETTRNTKANELYGKSFKDLSEAQKQLTLLAMVEEGNQLSGAIGQAARESDGLVNQLGNLKQGAVDAAADLGENFLPIVIDGMKLIGDWVEKFKNLDEGTQDLILKLGLVAAAAGPLFSTAGKITTGAGKLAGMIGKVTGAIAAKGGLLAVLGGGAVGLIALLGIAAGAMLIFGTEVSHGQRSLQDYKDAIAAADDQLKKSNDGTNEMAASAGWLAGKIDALSKVENKSAGQKEELAGYVRQLNKLMPELNLQYDKEADKLNASTGAIQAYITEYERKLKLQAAEEHLNSLIEAQVKLEQDRARQQEIVNEQRAEYMQIATQFEKYERDLAAGLVDDWYLATEGIDHNVIRLGSSFRQAERDLESMDEQLASGKKAIDGYAATFSDGMEESGDAAKKGADKQTKAITKGGDDVIKALKDHAAERRKQDEEFKSEEERRTANLKAAAEARLELVKKRNQDQIDYNNEFEKARKSHFDRLFNIDQEGLDQTGTTMAQATERLRAQVAAYRDWQANIALLAGKVPQSVISELEKLGPSQAQLIQDLVNATPEQLAEFIQAWQDAGYLASKEAEDEMGDIPGNTKLIAGASVDAMRSEKENMRQAGYEVGMAGKQGMQAGATGTDAVGRDMATGLVNGFSSRKAYVVSQAGIVAQAAVDRMRYVAQTHSPSKVTTEIGKNLGQGLEIGMDRSKLGVESAAAELSRSALAGFRGLDWMQNPAEFNMPETALSQKQVYVTGNSFTVREEADIQRIAAELEKQVRRQERSLA